MKTDPWFSDAEISDAAVAYVRALRSGRRVRIEACRTRLEACVEPVVDLSPAMRREVAAARIFDRVWEDVS